MGTFVLTLSLAKRTLFYIPAKLLLGVFFIDLIVGFMGVYIVKCSFDLSLFGDLRSGDFILLVNLDYFPISKVIFASGDLYFLICSIDFFSCGLSSYLNAKCAIFEVDDFNFDVFDFFFMFQ